MDSPNRGHLSGVKEEPYTRDSLEDQYFRMFLALTHAIWSMIWRCLLTLLARALRLY